MRTSKQWLGILLCLSLLAGCQPGESALNDPPPTDNPGITSSDVTPTATPTVTPTATPEATPRPVYTPAKEDVQLWDADTPLSGTLYIRDVDEYTTFAYWGFEEDMAAFLAMHPGVTIKFVTEKITYPDDPLRYLQLFDETANADIANVSFYEFYNYADKGYFVDLRQYMEADPNFHMEDYYTNVFDAYLYKGGQYAFPLSFVYDLAAMNKTAPDGLLADFTAKDGISTAQMIDMFTQSGLQGQKDMVSYTSFDRLVFDTITCEFIDYENKTCDFDNERFINLLQTSRAVLAEDMQTEEKASARFYTDRSDEREGQIAAQFLFRRVAPSEKQYVFPGFTPTNLFTDAIPIVNTQGEIPIWTTDLFAIPANSPNKALAWEFIKYLASVEVQSKRVYDEPVVNRAAFAAVEAENIALYLENDVYYFENHADREGVIAGYIDDTAAITAMTDEAIATHDKWNRMPMTIYTGMHRSVLNPVYDAIDLYFYDIYTEEQAAALVQEQVSAALDALR